jgi:hypothetical protein
MITNQALNPALIPGFQNEIVTPDPITPSFTEPVKTIKEIGGRNGLDPTRYGDWEKNGRCIDF